MTIEAPVIRAEMNEWKALGGVDLGIVGDQYHDYGFHLGANRVPPTDYSRWRDPNGSDGPYVNWDYACAGDFAHNHNEELRTRHRAVLAGLQVGLYPMICEFIGQPWAGQPVVYWARWNGIATLQRYTGSGHDKWSHISWFRSRADQRAYLWQPSPMGDDDMAFADAAELERKVYNLDRALTALLLDEDAVTGLKTREGQVVSYPLKLAQRVRALEARLADPVDEAALAAELAARLQPLAPGATVEQVREVVAGIRLVPGE